MSDSKNNDFFKAYEEVEESVNLLNELITLTDTSSDQLIKEPETESKPSVPVEEPVSEEKIIEPIVEESEKSFEFVPEEKPEPEEESVPEPMPPVLAQEEKETSKSEDIKEIEEPDKEIGVAEEPEKTDIVLDFDAQQAYMEEMTEEPASFDETQPGLLSKPVVPEPSVDTSSLDDMMVVEQTEPEIDESEALKTPAVIEEQSELKIETEEVQQEEIIEQEQTVLEEEEAEKIVIDLPEQEEPEEEYVIDQVADLESIKDTLSSDVAEETVLPPDEDIPEFPAPTPDIPDTEVEMEELDSAEEITEPTDFDMPVIESALPEAEEEMTFEPDQGELEEIPSRPETPADMNGEVYPQDERFSDTDAMDVLEDDLVKDDIQKAPAESVAQEETEEKLESEYAIDTSEIEKIPPIEAEGFEPDSLEDIEPEESDMISDSSQETELPAPAIPGAEDIPTDQSALDLNQVEELPEVTEPEADSFVDEQSPPVDMAPLETPPPQFLPDAQAIPEAEDAKAELPPDIDPTQLSGAQEIPKEDEAEKLTEDQQEALDEYEDMLKTAKQEAEDFIAEHAPKTMEPVIEQPKDSPVVEKDVKMEEPKAPPLDLSPGSSFDPPSAIPLTQPVDEPTDQKDNQNKPKGEPAKDGKISDLNYKSVPLDNDDKETKEDESTTSSFKSFLSKLKKQKD